MTRAGEALHHLLESVTEALRNFQVSKSDPKNTRDEHFVVLFTNVCLCHSSHGNLQMPTVLHLPVKTPNKCYQMVLNIFLKVSQSLIPVTNKKAHRCGRRWPTSGERSMMILQDVLKNLSTSLESRANGHCKGSASIIL